jgi:hypothetical protein
MKNRSWTELVFSLRQVECALVLGRELAAAHDLSTLDEADPELGHISNPLARHLARQLREEGKEVLAEDLAGVSQQYEEAEGFGSLALRTETVKFYRDPALTIPKLYEKLAALPFKLAVTTCQDHRFEQALERMQPARRPFRSGYNFRGDRTDNPEVPEGSLNAPLIYHLFGDIEVPNSLVLSENDLLDFLIGAVSGKPQLPNRLSLGLQRQSQSLLFIGFGLRQWYLRLLLKVLLRLLDLGQRAFALEPLMDLADGDRKQTVLLYRRGMRVEIIDMDAEAFLDELVERVRREGGVVQRSPGLGVRLRVFICHASEDKATARRLYDSLLAANCEPWLDTDALGGGDDWDARIETALRDTHYVVVLHSAALIAKTDAYVNKEIRLALERAARVRGNFVLPLVLDGVSEDEQIGELKKIQQLPLRDASFADDVGHLLRSMSRDFQLRSR